MTKGIIKRGTKILAKEPTKSESKALPDEKKAVPTENKTAPIKKIEAAPVDKAAISDKVRKILMADSIEEVGDDFELGKVMLDEKTNRPFKYVNVERTNVSKDGVVSKYVTRAKYFIKQGKRGRKKMPNKKLLTEKIKKLSESQASQVLELINKFLLTDKDVSEDELDDLPEDAELEILPLPDKPEDREDNIE